MIPLECSRGKEVIENHETLKFRIMIKSRIKPTILKLIGVIVSVLWMSEEERKCCKLKKFIILLFQHKLFF